MTNAMAPLAQLADGLWLADGPCLSVAGFGYPTRMAVVQLPDGKLWIWSPVALSDDLRAAVTALGPVAHVVAPNRLHHMALAQWQSEFPQAKTHAGPGLRSKRPDLRFDAGLDDMPDPDWAATIDQCVWRGNLIAEEVVFFHRPSGTVLVTDWMQQFPRGFHTGWRGIVARADLMVGDRPQVPRKFRLATVNRPAARTGVRKVLGWPVRTLVVAHGTPVTEGAADCIRQAFRWLRV